MTHIVSNVKIKEWIFPESIYKNFMHDVSALAAYSAVGPSWSKYTPLLPVFTEGNTLCKWSY